MPILLYGVGAVAFAMGAAAIGYGIPINEFSFGNTLIICGTVLASAGLVVLALGVVVGKLQQLSEVLGRPAGLRPGRVEAEMPVPLRAGVQPARMPFPPKPKAPPPRPDSAPEAAPPPEPMPAESKAEMPPVPARPFAMPPLPKRPFREPEDLAAAPSPLLPNPELGAEPEPDEGAERSSEAPADEAPRPDVEPSLRFPPFRPDELQAASEGEAEAAEPAEPERTETPIAEPAEREFRRPEPMGLEPFRGAAPVKAEPGSFDAMWPASGKPADANPPKPGEAAPDQPHQEPDLGERPRDEPRAVAILKSGVVDGMGYTLYVDGSIEAELPQGTLRFASINELRAHLEKTG
ncbi:MAG: hypothetical protein JSR61_16040 [Proteobacteria bacterium]|nr:hypothetical protein [Pseudomonadota bacterium]